MPSKHRPERRAHLLPVVKVVLHAADVLVGFVSFAGHENNIARTGQRNSRFDRLAAVVIAR